jgi:NAD(P)-dependent dehydrogenase (short-subunit alcohol dehydrogenase family)
VSTLLIGTDVPEVRLLAEALEAEFVAIPPIGGGDVGWPAAALDAWRDDVAAGPSAERIAVAAWSATHEAGPLVDADAAEFAVRCELPFATWFAALGAAVQRAVDGGSVLAIVERPPPLDCAGWAPESGVADAVEAFVRSLARSEGPRDLRVNAVTTPARLIQGAVPAPPPPLASFPGTVEREVAAAAQMLLGGGVLGVTGTVVHADGGRSWR